MGVEITCKLEGNEADGQVGTFLRGTVTTQLWQDWFNDARWEAENPLAIDNYQYRRREVIFAVCFAETYLFEWTLLALGLDGEKLMRYFPKGDLRGVTARWVEVPAALRQDGLLKADLPVNEEWQTLIGIRNGLTHSKASWPEVVFGRPARHPKPRPVLLELGARAPGWALGVARERVQCLHTAAGTSVPEWITKPIPFDGCPSCQRPLSLQAGKAT